MNRKRLPFIVLCSLTTMAAGSVPPPLPGPPHQRPISKAQAGKIDALFAALDAVHADIPDEARWYHLGDSISIDARDGIGTLVMYSVDGSEAVGIVAGKASPCLSQRPESYRVDGRAVRLVHACIDNDHVASAGTAAARRAMMERLAAADSVTVIGPTGRAMRFDLRGLPYARKALRAMREFDPPGLRNPDARDIPVI